MAFERRGYTLYAREQRARGEKFQKIYFFSKRRPIVGQGVDLPDGYVVAIDRKTGIPYLRKK